MVLAGAGTRVAQGAPLVSPTGVHVDEADVAWELIMTGAAISTLPTLIVFLIFQRFIIRGVVMAGLKG